MDTLLLSEITRNIAIALQEDQVNRDLTSKSCFSESAEAVAKLVLKEEALVAGLIFLPLICYAVDPKIELEIHKEEGQRGQRGDILATFKGSIYSLMAIERTALNFVQHATSIASRTVAYVAATQGKCEILDTRKTLPGHRFLQKYAVSIGGGTNHRFHLADQILIKDNHLAHLKSTTNKPIQESIRRAQEKYPEIQVQVEVGNLEELKEALEEKPDRILLDNMTPEEVKEAVRICPDGIYLEASGNIDLKTICSYANTGIHGISIGKLTHSIEAVDMSLKIYTQT